MSLESLQTTTPKSFIVPDVLVQMFKENVAEWKDGNNASMFIYNRLVETLIDGVDGFLRVQLVSYLPNVILDDNVDDVSEEEADNDNDSHQKKMFRDKMLSFLRGNGQMFRTKDHRHEMRYKKAPIGPNKKFFDEGIFTKGGAEFLLMLLKLRDYARTTMTKSGIKEMKDELITRIKPWFKDNGRNMKTLIPIADDYTLALFPERNCDSNVGVADDDKKINTFMMFVAEQREYPVKVTMLETLEPPYEMLENRMAVKLNFILYQTAKRAVFIGLADKEAEWKMEKCEPFDADLFVDCLTIAQWKSENTHQYRYFVATANDVDDDEKKKMNMKNLTFPFSQITHVLVVGFGKTRYYYVMLHDETARALLRDVRAMCSADTTISFFFFFFFVVPRSYKKRKRNSSNRNEAEREK